MIPSREIALNYVAGRGNNEVRQLIGGLLLFVMSYGFYSRLPASGTPGFALCSIRE